MFEKLNKYSTYKLIFLPGLKQFKMLQSFQKSLLYQNLRCYTTATAVKTKEQTKKPANKFKQNAIITCKHSELNLYTPASPSSKFGDIPLASKGWLHNKSKGDYFTLHATVKDEEIQSKMQSIEKFLQESNLRFYPELLENIRTEFGIRELTAIQTLGIPKVFDYNHTLIAAETGCGKTLTYLLPIVQRILERKRASTNTNANERKLNTPLALIITPGRELATQIGEVTQKLANNTELKVKTILGGNTKRLMMNPDFEDVDVLVATIGALSKLVTTGVYRMEEVRHLVLDEADTLFDDSFTEKLGHFLRKFPFHKNHMQDGTQLVLASATMPTNIEELLKSVIDTQTIHEVTSPNLHKLMPHVEQKFLRLSKANRPPTLLNIVKTELKSKHPLIIFSNKSRTSDYVSLFLTNNGIKCLNLNGDMLMKIRLGRFEKFQNGEFDVLSTTDVGSRGLDTTRARHVINFEFPLFVSDYIHRCGRIGRVGSFDKCVVSNFISSRSEINVVQKIEHAARTGGLLPNVNANIKNLLTKHIMKEIQATPKDFFEF